MKHFRIRLTKYPPSWNDPTFLGEFDFQMTALRARLRVEIENFEAYPALQEYPARVEWNAQLQKLELEFLELESRSGDPFIWSRDRIDDVWYFLDRMALAGQWQQVRCAQCGAWYSFDDCHIESWMEGEGLCAEGGRHLFCPASHLLCGSREWNS